MSYKDIKLLGEHCEFLLELHQQGLDLDKILSN